MAHRYSAGVLSASSVPAGGVYAEMLAGATKSISVREIRVVSGSGLGGHVAIARAFAIGTGAATGIATGVSARLGSTPTTSARMQMAWTSSGVSPTGFGTKMRTEILAAATGADLALWRYDDGPIVVEPNGSLLIVNGGSGIQGGPMFVNVVWEEGPSSDS